MKKKDTDQTFKLFTDDELDPVQLTPEPVTCLGMTFSSNEERREYFRAELRRKLPELRQIEGFPIGEDEDIIALSDPPYYTACPNPWLNDFIAQWEQEKTQLEAEGKRTKDFSVWEPYASDVSEGKNNPIYNAHSYHTKVPHPAIMRYILHYTQPGDIVFDGFCGTGMTGVAASCCENPDAKTKDKIEKEFKLHKYGLKWGERKAILSDLSSDATLIAANYNTPYTHERILSEIEDILQSCEEKLGWLYQTKTMDGKIGEINYTVWSDVFLCPNCSNEYVFYNVAVNESTNEIYEKYKCPHCGAEITKKESPKSIESYFDSKLNKVCTVQKKIPVLINYTINNKSYSKTPTEDDISIINKAQKLAAICNYPIDRMIEGSESRRNDRQGITHVHQFYFPRTLIIFSELFKHCNSKEMIFLLNSQLINLSKLNRYRPGKSFPYNPLSGTLYIGSQISESNVFIALKNKLKKLKQAFSLVVASNAVGTSSATNIALEKDSVDYIFTDPPFGANIFYSELNYIQESWIKVKTENSLEATENETLNKTKNVYYNLMAKSFREYYRILKPQRWLTVEFSNTSAAIWNAIQQAIQTAGFIIVNVSALDKQAGSFKAITTTTAVKQDLVITCFKPSDKMRLRFEEKGATQQSAQDFIEELLIHLPVHVEKDNSTTAIVERSAKILYDRLISYYVQHGYAIPMDAREFQQMLHDSFIERDGMFFTASQAVEYEEKRAHTTEFVPMALFISSEAEGIEWLKRHLSKKPQTYQELQPEWMKDMAAPKKGDIIPELRDILEENFIEESDGTWRNPDAEKAADLEILRNRRMLKEFTAYMEQATKPKAKRMKDCRLAVLQFGFKECYRQKRFADIVAVGDHIPESLLTEDEVLLQYYDIALTRI